MTEQLPPLSFFDFHALDISREVLDACAVLFSSDYGVWSDDGPWPGHNVKLSARKLQALLLFDSDTCRLAVAKTVKGEVVAHAFYCNFPYVPAGQRVVWITQLVVKTEYRGQHIARTLLKSACGDKGLFACCLVSCNPLAVRALCSAVGRQPDLYETAAHVERLVEASSIPYIQGKQIKVSPGHEECSKMLTDFHVCHPHVKRDVHTWKLGSLQPGEEFLAIVFPPGSQSQSGQ